MGNPPDMSAELKAEVAEAVKILREDGHSVRLTAIEAKLNKHFPDEPPPDPDPDPNAPPPPPPVDPKPPASQRQSKSRFRWWPEDEPPKADAT